MGYPDFSHWFPTSLFRDGTEVLFDDNPELPTCQYPPSDFCAAGYLNRFANLFPLHNSRILQQSKPLIRLATRSIHTREFALRYSPAWVIGERRSPGLNDALKQINSLLNPPICQVRTR